MPVDKNSSANQFIQEWANHLIQNIKNLKKRTLSQTKPQEQEFQKQIKFLHKEIEDGNRAVEKVKKEYKLLVEKYLKKISYSGFLFSSQNPEQNIKRLEMLIGYSLVIDDFFLLKKWGIEPLQQKIKQYECKQVLGKDKNYYRQFFKKKKEKIKNDFQSGSTSTSIRRSYYDTIYAYDNILKLFT